MKNIIVLTVLSLSFGNGQKSKLSSEHYQNVRKALRQKMRQQCRSSVQCTDKKSRQ